MTVGFRGLVTGPRIHRILRVVRSEEDVAYEVCVGRSTGCLVGRYASRRRVGGVGVRGRDTFGRLLVGGSCCCVNDGRMRCWVVRVRRLRSWILVGLYSELVC